MKFHHVNKLPLSENVYRPFSDEYFSLINESRKLYNEGNLDLCEDDIWLLNTDIGKTGIYEGDVVWLDIPFLIEEDEEDLLREAEYRGRKVKLGSPFRTPGGPKKFAVYVKNKNGNPLGCLISVDMLNELRASFFVNVWLSQTISSKQYLIIQRIS